MSNHRQRNVPPEDDDVGRRNRSVTDMFNEILRRIDKLEETVEKGRKSDDIMERIKSLAEEAKKEGIGGKGKLVDDYLAKIEADWSAHKNLENNGLMKFKHDNNRRESAKKKVKGKVEKEKPARIAREKAKGPEEPEKIEKERRSRIKKVKIWCACVLGGLLLLAFIFYLIVRMAIEMWHFYGFSSPLLEYKVW